MAIVEKDEAVAYIDYFRQILVSIFRPISYEKPGQRSGLGVLPGLHDFTILYNSHFSRFN